MFAAIANGGYPGPRGLTAEVARPFVNYIGTARNERGTPTSARYKSLPAGKRKK